MGDVADFVGDILGDVGDFVGDVFESVAKFVADIVKTIVDIVVDIVSWIVDVIEDAIDWICEHPVLAVVITAVFCCVFIPTLTVVFADVAALTTGQLGVGLTAWDIIQVGVWSFVEALASSWASFASIIHFKTLMALNSLGMLISADYRAMVYSVYNQIGTVSRALGLGPNFMTLALMNTRTLVLDVSSAMGKNYDLAELTWIKALNDILKATSLRLEYYENNPASFLMDLGNYTEKRFIDAKAGYANTIFMTIDTTIKTLEAGLDHVARISFDVERLIYQTLPGLKGHWIADINKRIKEVHKFFNTDIFPMMHSLEMVMKNWTGKTDKLDSSVKGLTQRLLHPGDYLKEIDKLGLDERLRQENIVSDIANRPYKRDTEQLRQEYQLTESRLKAIVSALDRVIPLPAWHVPEIETPVRPAGVAATPRVTWFVGDY